MAYGAWAQSIHGTCVSEPLRGGLSAVCTPYREFTVHTVLADPPAGAGYETGTFACGQNTPGVSSGTASLPQFSVQSTVVSSGDVYGRRPVYPNTPVALTQVDGTPVLFNAADLAPWRKRARYSPNIYQMFAQGPAVERAHFVTEVRRRLKGSGTLNNKNYQNRYQFDFTDATTPIFGQTDWLGQLHPASHFWTNKGVNEPFLAVTHYEQSGQSPPSESHKQWLLPFCSPLTVRNTAGTSLGQYIGYTVIYYWSFAFVHYADTNLSRPDINSGTPTKVFLPEDYRDTNPVAKRRINHINQLWTLDGHWFMVGTGTAGSPKIGSTRYWFYNDATASVNPCDPYYYAIHGPFQGKWEFDVAFDHVGGGSENIRLGLSSMRAYVTP